MKIHKDIPPSQNQTGYFQGKWKIRGPLIRNELVKKFLEFDFRGGLFNAKLYFNFNKKKSKSWWFMKLGFWLQKALYLAYF